MIAPAARKAEAEGCGGIIHFDILPKIKPAEHPEWFAKIDQWNKSILSLITKTMPLLKQWVKILLLNNDFQGMVKQWQDLFYEERYSSTRMFNPDFVKLSEAMGVKGLRCSDSADLPRVMTEFLTHPGPVVLEAKVDKA